MRLASISLIGLIGLVAIISFTVYQSQSSTLQAQQLEARLSQKFLGLDSKLQAWIRTSGLSHRQILNKLADVQLQRPAAVNEVSQQPLAKSLQEPELEQSMQLPEQLPELPETPIINSPSDTPQELGKEVPIDLGKELPMPENLPGRWGPHPNGLRWAEGKVVSQVTGRIAKASLLGPARTPETLGTEYWPAVADATGWKYTGKQGWQMALSVDGEVGCLHRDVSLVVTLHVKGAIVQQTREKLCRLFEPDLNKPRRCSATSSGTFHARTYLYFPALLPMSPSASLDLNLDFMSGALSADQELVYKEDRQNIDAMVKAGFISQVQKDQHRMIIKTFTRAVSELPGPFTIIESGNFCGGVTQLLAVLKRKYCPLCRFMTIDPTLQAHQNNYKKHSCSAKRTLDMLGLADLVEVHEYFSGDMHIPGPIGYAYFDDGKIREAMAPQFALVERFLMDGAYIGFDDYTQMHPIKTPDGWAKHVPKVNDHKELILELVSSGDYDQRAAGEVSKQFGCLQRRPRAKLGVRSGADEPWAQVDVSLRHGSGTAGTSISHGVVTIQSPDDFGLTVKSR